MLNLPEDRVLPAANFIVDYGYIKKTPTRICTIIFYVYRSKTKINSMYLYVTNV